MFNLLRTDSKFIYVLATKPKTFFSNSTHKNGVKQELMMHFDDIILGFNNNSYRLMKEIILLAAFVLLVSSSNMIEVNNDKKSVRDPNEGVLQCINRVSPLIDDPDLFCGPMIAKNAACFSSYYSLKVCLVNNDC